MGDRIYIKGIGVCCPDDTVLGAFQLKTSPVDNSLIPAAIRRRTSLTTRMAITAATLACANAHTDSQHLASVFASMGGEIQVTDALCKLLPDSEALLSPTQFHNSVHNTTAGYWSILNECQAPTTALAAADDTFAMGLLEAWTQLQFQSKEVLLVCYDELWPQYLAPPVGEQAFACALVLSSERDDATAAITKPEIVFSTAIDNAWASLVDSVPAAAAIPLLQAFGNPKDSLYVPLNNRGAIWHTFFESYA